MPKIRIRPYAYPTSSGKCFWRGKNSFSLQVWRIVGLERLQTAVGWCMAFLLYFKGRKHHLALPLSTQLFSTQGSQHICKHDTGKPIVFSCFCLQWHRPFTKGMLIRQQLQEEVLLQEKDKQKVRERDTHHLLPQLQISTEWRCEKWALTFTGCYCEP